MRDQPPIKVNKIKEPMRTKYNQAKHLEPGKISVHRASLHKSYW